MNLFEVKARMLQAKEPFLPLLNSFMFFHSYNGKHYAGHNWYTDLHKGHTVLILESCLDKLLVKDVILAITWAN